jgi:hypothetical protein
MAGVATRKGEYAMAARHQRAALDSASWENKRCVMKWGGYTVYLDNTLDYGSVYVHHERKAIIVHKSTWDVVNSDTTLVADFLTQMKGGAGGLKFLVMDSGKYGEAARAAAHEWGNDVVQAKDEITQVTEILDSLLVQAQGLNKRATPLQMQSFAVRYAEAEGRMVSLETRLGMLRAKLDLAGLTLDDVAG